MGPYLRDHIVFKFLHLTQAFQKMQTTISFDCRFKNAPITVTLSLLQILSHQSSSTIMCLLYIGVARGGTMGARAPPN